MPAGSAAWENNSNTDGWKFFRNACSVVTDLSFNCHDLMAVQALVGIVRSDPLIFTVSMLSVVQAFVLDILLDAEAAYIALGTAARLATALGLHRKFEDVNLSASEVIHRRNVFWAIYIFDKIMSLRLGRPPVINDSDVEVDPPDDFGALGQSDFGDLSNFFSSHVKLSRIESDIYSELYSARSRTKSVRERLRSIGALDRRLRQWQESLPTSIQPEKPILCSTDLIPHAILLQFEYFNAVSTLHRSSVYTALITGDESGGDMPSHGIPDVDPRVFSSHLICLDAARHTAKLLISLNRASHQPRDNLVR